MGGVIFSGKLKNQNHVLTFKVLEDNTVKVIQSYTINNVTKSRSKRISIDEGITLQEKYINLGYHFSSSY
tara:strand:- start:98 stop:307 length:210 start_codon:yes stop_codon:yes gene_type:complete